jgi:hypothetical protein
MITARRVRSHGAISLSEHGDLESYVATDYTPKKEFSVRTHHTGSSSSRTGNTPVRTGTPPVDMGSPQPLTAAEQQEEESRWAQFNFSPMRHLRNARQSILPSYHSSSPLKYMFHSRSSSTYSRSTSGESKKPWARKRPESEIPDMPLNISAPLNVNPNFAHLVKPNLAHHPSTRRPEAEDGLKEFKF